MQTSKFVNGVTYNAVAEEAPYSCTSCIALTDPQLCFKLCNWPMFGDRFPYIHIIWVAKNE